MKICYFGIYLADFGRNKIYINALRKAGHTVLECNDISSGLTKFWRLYKKHKKLKDNYDFLIVGYPGHMLVPFAKLISKKPVVADLLGSLYDAEVNSHNPSWGKKIKARVADFVAVKFADKVLLESEAQKKYFELKFGKSDKYKVVHTGASEAFSNPVIPGPKEDKIFTVLFRGRLTAECGIKYILGAAKILKENEKIRFLFIGRGPLLKESEKIIEKENLRNITFIKTHLEEDELVEMMGKASLSLGQFDNNPRLNRTIPHKAYESFALGIPYLTGNAEAIKEIAQDGENAFFAPLADAKSLAEKILFLSRNPDLLKDVAQNAKAKFDLDFSSRPLSQKIIQVASWL